MTPLRLSHGQAALWFLNRMAPGGDAYNLVAAARVRVPAGAALDAARLARAFEAVAARHPELRATFAATPVGTPEKTVHERLAPELLELDATGWSEQDVEERLAAEASRPFDLERGPLLRAVLVTGAGAPCLLIAVHHVAADFWSLGLIARELGAFYEEGVPGTGSGSFARAPAALATGIPSRPSAGAAGREAERQRPGESPYGERAGTKDQVGTSPGGEPGTRLPPAAPRASYDEHVRRERERLAGPRGERLWSYWSERLHDVPDLDLPADRPRPARPFHRGGTVPFRVDAEVTAGLRALARGRGATLFATLLAGFGALLARTAGQNDFAVGVPAAGRSSADQAGTVGYFVQPLALRADLAGSPTVAELVDRARRTVREGLAHQALPFALLAERLRPVRIPGKPPLVQAMLVFHQARRPGEEAFPAFVLGQPGAVLPLGNALALDPIPLPPREVSFDLTLALAEEAPGETAGGLAGELLFSAELFDEATIRRMADRLGRLLAGMAADPAARVDELPWVGEAELHQVLHEWNDTARAPGRPVGLYRRFAGQAARTPEAVAAVHGEERVTYAELDRRARELARRLRVLGVGPERVVGVSVERGIDMVTALLGVLAAGGAYLPLDPSLPRERRELMQEDARAVLTLTRARMRKWGLGVPGRARVARPGRAGEGVAGAGWEAGEVAGLVGENAAASVADEPAGLAGEKEEAQVGGNVAGLAGRSAPAPDAEAAVREDAAVPAPAASVGPAAGASTVPASAASAGPAPEASTEPTLAPGEEPGGLSYVIYTSGSTGRPKGVAVTHGSASALLDWAADAFLPEEMAGVFAATSIGFDISVFEIFAPLAVGGTVILGENVLALHGLPGADGVTLVNTVPSAMAELLRLGPLPASVRAVCLAGEALPAELVLRVREAAPGARVRNLYGPTEDTVYSTGAEVDGAGPPPIGRPLPGTRARVLDLHLRPVPIGVPGELALAGAGLARGYLGRPDLTAERFVPDPLTAPEVQEGLEDQPEAWNPAPPMDPSSRAAARDLGGGTAPGSPGCPDGAPDLGPGVGARQGLGGAPGARLYLTGDRARLRPDGAIELLGRADQQVKVRGVRIELGEVEAALLRQPSVREAAAGVREVGGSRVLVAWVALSSTSVDDGVAALRSALAASLPSAMVPTSWVVLPALPRMPSGKVDRRSLPAPARGGAGRAATPPRDAVEEALAAVWREVLEIDRVGIEETFFDLGGHSLLAMRLLARIRQVLGVELPVRSLFERPTIALLAREVVAAPPRPAPPLVPVPRDGDLPLSYAQERLWFLDRLAPGSAAYNMPGAFLLSGPLRAEVLAAAFGELVRRHEVLRTRFVRFGNAAGRPVLAIDPPAHFPLPRIDLRSLTEERREAEARRLAGEEARRPFDLERGPLLRTMLALLAPGEHLLLVTAHHIAFDGWSLGLVSREIAELVGAALAGRPAVLPALPVQYADFARWQRECLAGETLAVQLAAWREQLAGAPVLLDLPADRPRPEVQGTAGGRLPLALPAELGEALHALAHGREASPFMVLAAAFQALLGRATGSEDLLLGTPVANRRRVEVEPLVGLFVNTLVLRGDLAGDPPFAELLARVRERALAAFLHQDLPFERLVEELAPGRSPGFSPLVQVLLVLQNAAEGNLALPGVAVQPLAVETGTAKLDLTLEIAEDLAGGAIEFRRDLFDDATVDRLAASFAALLAAAVAAPGRRLSELPLLARTAARQVAAPERIVPLRPYRRRKERQGSAADLAVAGRAHLAQLTPTEEILAGLWAELLGPAPFGREDDFFDWGGHSLLATLLVSRLRQTFGVEIPVRDLFAAPTLAGLAARVDAALGQPGAEALPPVEPAVRTGALPLSFAQQRLWLLDRLAPGGSTYNLPLAVRLAGPLDAAALEWSLGAVIDRHEALRTRFVRFLYTGGEPAQVVAPRGEGPALLLPRIDLSALPGGVRPEGIREMELGRRLAAEAAQPFDLAAGPVIRACLFELGGGQGGDGRSVEWALALTVHHIAADGWSIGVLVRELAALYQKEVPPSLPVQPADFAVWQRRWLAGEVLEAQLAWWRERLAGVPPLELPADRPRPAFTSERGRQVPLALAEGLWQRAGAAARRLGATPFMALAGALAVMLCRWSGQTDFALGFPVANRRRPEIEGLVGLFANSLVLRADLAGEPDAIELLRRTRDAALGAYAHQDLPFEKLVEELGPRRDLGRSPIFQVLLALAPPLPALELPGLVAAPVDVHSGTAKFDLSWLWREEDAGLAGSLEHSSDLFDGATALRMAGLLERLLDGLTESLEEAPDRPVLDLPLLSAAEEAQLAREWNDTGEVPAASLPALIVRQLKRTPDAIALVAGEARLTYARLDRRASDLAARLSALGLAPEARVAVCLERSADLVAALLGVWKAGGAYVPLDPAWPRERLLWMLEDSGAAAIVGRRERVAGLAGPVLAVVDPAEAADGSAGSAPISGREYLTRPAFPDIEPAKEEEKDSGKGAVKSRREDVAGLTGSARPIGDPVEEAGPDPEAVAFGSPREQMAGPPGSTSPAKDPVKAGDLPARLAQGAIPLPGSLAYVIYTSGSTGRPKGVGIEHGSAAALALWAREVFSREEMTGVLASTSVCFDLSVFELFVPLSLGGTVILARDALALPTLPAADEVTLVNTVPSAIDELVRAGALPASVRTVCLAGEALRRDLVDRLHSQPGLRVLNLYGPSEDTTYSTWAVMRREERGSPPIGRPVAGTRVHLLDVAGREVPPGAAGELCLAGVGLARGYLGRPELTAERFVPDPRGGAFAARHDPDGALGARLYRTGDLARMRADGSLEFLGRIDHQVKVRGFRIEPGEVEAALAGHPAVRAAVVVAREGAGGDRILVAWLVLEPGSGAVDPPDGLRSWLLARLPEPLVPGVFAVVDALPLTPSGKVDRLALARRPLPTRAPAPSRAPRTPLEGAVAAIWSQVLGVERVGIDDDFFALGGHSLLAARLASRLGEALGIELPLRALFEEPTVERLARRLETAPPAAAEPPLTACLSGEDPPLSFAQERLWFLDRLEGGAALNLAASVRLMGELDIPALAAALAEVERRHEVLRTAYPEEDGRPRQVVAPPRPPRLPLVDLDGLPAGAGAAEAERLRDEFSLAPFDLAAGPPWRTLLLRSGAREHALLLAFHHVATDGWALGVFTREVAALYSGLAAGSPAALPAPPPFQYADFALWQRRRADDERLGSQLAWWRERLAGDLPAEPLVPDRPRSASRRRRAAAVERRAPPAVTARLRSLGRSEGASLYMVLLAALGVLLARHGGSEEAVVGSPVAGRTRPETERVIGCFLNTLALRLSIAPDVSSVVPATFRTLLAHAREVVLAALAHQEAPFERVLEEVRPERDAARTPLFQVLLNMLNFPRVAARLPGLELELVPGPLPPPRFDLTLYAEEAEDAVRLSWVWDADLFAPDRREEIADQLDILLEQVASDPDVEIAALSLVTRRAAERLPDPTAALVPDAGSQVSPVERFVVQALRHPDAVAVVDREAAWTYGELLRASRRLARALRESGVRPGDVVAIHAHRSAALVRAVLGVAQAGAVFLILDRDDPAARLTDIVRAARPCAWLQTTPETLPDEVERCLAELAPLRLDVSTPASLRAWGDAGPVLTAEPGAPTPLYLEKGFRENLEAWPEGDPDAPAYLAFTSGSTGRPKGIVGSWRGVSHFLGWHAQTFGLDSTDRFSLLSGLGHDPLLRDLFTPLSLGATLTVPDPDELGSPGWLAHWMAREAVTVAHLTPAMAQLLTGTAGDARLPGLRRAFFGGDALRRRDVDRLLALAPGAACVNFYGATETPQAMAWHAVAPDSPGTSDEGKPASSVPIIPLGRGIDGVQLLVLTAAGRRVGLGEAGEIWIRTPYLALGYLDDEALTRERFISNWFVPAPALHDRLYRTGDLGCHLLDGQVRPLGRADRQVKIRGFRVEPAEIEAVLARQEGVGEALAMLRGDRLVAYVVPADSTDPGLSLSPAALREALRRTLPSYMVPAAIAVLAGLPLTANGKVDRAALPDPEREDDSSFVAPQGPLEALVAEVWAGVLGLPRVGAEDDFFALGGHSLLATQVVSRLREACGVELPLRALFEAATPAALARRIEEARRGRPDIAPPIRRIPRDGELPLSFAQQRLWFLDQMAPGNPGLHLATALRLSGALAVPAIAAALREVVRRHETLRTTFGAREGRPWQTIAAATADLLPDLLPVIDLAVLPPEAGEREVRRQVPALAWAPFDLSRGPLLRAVLLRLDAGEHALLLTLHHIVSDGWSTAVLCDELAVLYAAFRDGRPSPLPELPVQYVDFASWQRDRLNGELLAARLASWRAALALESGAPPVLELPTDRPRPPVPGFRGARRPVLLPRELADGLLALGRQRGATLFMVLMAGFQALLHRWSGQDELWVGSPVANRTAVEVERLIGMFFNLLALRSEAGDDPSFAAALARAREAALTAYFHQDLPFEKLLEELQPERHLGRTPLFQATLVLQNAPRAAVELPGLTLTPLEIDQRSANFDLNLQLTEQAAGSPHGIAGWLEYRTDLFDAATVERMAAHLGNLLAAAVADPGERLSRLEILSPGERRQLLAEWNDTAAPFPAATLHGLFAAQAERTPEALAVVAAGRTLTYRELDIESARLARRLRSLGVAPGVPVAVSLERGAEMATALLAVLRAGGFYVPLEPAWPEARVAAILASLGVAHVLSGPSRLPRLRSLGIPGLKAFALADLDGPPEGPPEGAEPGADRPPGAELPAADDPDLLAYVVFTSGSTGLPKGVMVQHRPVANLVHWVNRTFGVGPGDRLLFVTSLAFDLSVYDLFGILAAGGTVRVAGEDEVRDPEALARAFCREPITLWDSAPAALAQVVPFLPAAGGDRGRLRLAFLSGDWIPLPLPGTLKAAFPRVQVVALGGATEATVWSNSFAVGELLPHWVSIPYGRPIANARYHVLDGGMQPCPAGVPGELYIGGECLSAGYAGDPELTAAKYLPDPWAWEGAARLYRTGDRARWLADGNVEILGRVDRQVKVRGFRIELGEVEAALLAHPAVAAAVVAAQADDGPRGDKRLVAYVVPEPGQAAPAGEAEAAEASPEAQVGRWQVVYDEVYGRAAAAPADPTLNLAGWVSSYTGEPLPEAEMRAWVEATVERILARGGERGPGRVLEIGCGTGMLLFRIAPRSLSYEATDLSEVSLHYVRRQLAARGLEGVSLARRAADDWQGVEPGSLDTVILNSVTQHFPGIDYLRRVLAGAVRAVAPGGFVFVGDVRSLPLLDAFHASVELARAPAGLGRAELARRIRRRAAQEEELLVDPRCFTGLGTSLPGLARVEVQVKRGRERNEMSRFRFDAVLHVGGTSPQAATRCDEDGPGAGAHTRETACSKAPRAAPGSGTARTGPEPPRQQEMRSGTDLPPAARVPAAPWLDWTGEALSLPRLGEILVTGATASLGVRGIPDDRLRAEAAILSWLTDAAEPETVGSFRRVLDDDHAGLIGAPAGVEPEDLWELGRRHGYEVEVRNAPEPGRCDALFRRAGTPAAAWPAGPEPAPAVLANDPLAGAFARKLVPRLRAWLAERLPEPMVPSAIVPLDALPLTPNGKVDRRALPAPDGARPDLEEELVAPETATERRLAAIWSEVLGVERIGVHDNFFALGGDSILSIQVVARAQQAGLRLTPRQLFQHQTVAELAALAESSGSATGDLGDAGDAGEQGPVSGSVPITPIQRWFFEQELPDPHHWNLAVMLEPRQAIRPADLHHVAARLLTHHDALRLRFRREGAGWSQRIEPPCPAGSPAPCSTLDLAGLPRKARTAALEAAAAALQESLDLESGPLHRFALFRCGPGEPDRLLLLVHHLAVDGVSWRILLEDLESGLGQLGRGEEIRLPPKTTSYRRWAELLAERAGAVDLAREADHWLASAGRRAPALPVDFPAGPAGANLEGSAHTVKVALDAEETRVLLREVPAVFQTRIDDLLLTALARAFRRWTGSGSLLLDLEGHGRGEVPAGIDLSRTVGWFTTIYPALLEVSGGEPEEDLLAVKEQLRRVPAGGAGYGLLRYGGGAAHEPAHEPAHEDVARRLALLPQPQVIFNDLGQLDNLGDGTLARPARESFGATRSPRARRRHLLEIYATVLGGRLELDFEHSAAVHRASTVERLAGWFLEELRGLVDRCRAAGAAGVRSFTPSDFPEADLDQEDLAELLEQIS